VTPDIDARLMAAALRLGRSGLGTTWPNPSVGCLLVRFESGAPVIIGRGVTASGGRPHAETQAIAEAGDAAGGATAYVTLEPCSHFGRTPPCADALIAAGVARVVVALRDPDPRVAGQGIARLRAAGVAVSEGVGTQEAERDHAGHVARVRYGRPFVLLKMAVSADGKLGRVGKRVAITGEAANRRVHMMRAAFDAILVGIGTVLADDPLLTVRLPGMAERSPVRVLFDASLRLPHDSRLVSTARSVPVHVFTGYGASAARAEALATAGVAVHRVPRPMMTSSGIDVTVALRDLVKLGITRLMVEGGGTLAADFLARDLVDEAVILRGAEPLGDDVLAGVRPGPLDGLCDPSRFDIDAPEPLGRDLVTRYRRRR